MSQVLAHKLERRSRDAAARAGEIARQIRETIAHTRALARGLSPVSLEAEGLMSALTELAANTETIFHVVCRFHYDSPVPVKDPAVATHLFRIAQEAVSNALRHGKTVRSIRIELLATPGEIVLRVSDDGAGFPPANAPVKDTGMGLHIMQARTGMIGGTLAVGPNPGGGARVSVSIPRQPPPSPQPHG